MEWSSPLVLTNFKGVRVNGYIIQSVQTTTWKSLRSGVLNKSINSNNVHKPNFLMVYNEKLIDKWS